MVHRQLANSLAAMMLCKQFPDGSIAFKGGTALLWRINFEAARFTRDLDASSSLDRTRIVELMASLSGLRHGPFVLGNARLKSPKTSHIEQGQLLVEAELPILYGNSDWRTVVVEILPADSSALSNSQQVVLPVGLMERLPDLGVPPIGKLAVISVERQVADKLDGLSIAGSQRGRDLYDIWALGREVGWNLSEILTELERTLGHDWHLRFEGWAPDSLHEATYLDAVSGIADAPNFAAASDYVRSLIDDLHVARQGRNSA
jgi:hypothetical protein